MNKKFYGTFFLFVIWSLRINGAFANLEKTNAMEVDAPLTTATATTNNELLQPTHLHPIDLKLALTRVLQFRITRDEDGKSEAVSPQAKSIARTLSSLQPTLISGLLHISENSPLRPGQVEMFTIVRKEVLAANPRCKFDVVINASKYATAAEFINKLQEINAKIMPDLIIFRLPSNNEMLYPSALIKAMEFAHAHGQLVGYEGPTAMIPDAVDVIVVRAKSFEVRREEVSFLKSKHHLPILVKVPYPLSGPGKIKILPSLESLDSHEGESPKERQANSMNGHKISGYMQAHDHQEEQISKEILINEQTKLLMRLAEEQSVFGYHLMYPIASPSQQDHLLQVASDNALLVTMKALMARWN
ncbi:MAG: hypothetical protein ACH346_01225 [Chthoniobacterales bacterium]